MSYAVSAGPRLSGLAPLRASCRAGLLRLPGCLPRPDAASSRRAQRPRAYPHPCLALARLSYTLHCRCQGFYRLWSAGHSIEQPMMGRVSAIAWADSGQSVAPFLRSLQAGPGQRHWTHVTGILAPVDFGLSFGRFDDPTRPKGRRALFHALPKCRPQSPLRSSRPGPRPSRRTPAWSGAHHPPCFAPPSALPPRRRLPCFKALAPRRAARARTPAPPPPRTARRTAAHVASATSAPTTCPGLAGRAG